MKTKHIIASFLFTLAFPLSVFALSTPTVDAIPKSVNADIYTLVIHTEPGAKVNVIGGPAFIAPVTDGMGTDEEEDGIVEVTVGLAQEEVNSFSINVELDGETSDSIVVEVNETERADILESHGDTTPPPAPVLDVAPEEIEEDSYQIQGSAEADSTVYARTPDGEVAAVTQASQEGVFTMLLKFERGKTNRFNISAKDEAGNEGEVTQYVVRVLELKGGPAMTEEEPSRHNFADVKGHWGEIYINELYEAGIVSGKTDALFDPDGKITRAELTKIAMNAFGYNIPQQVTSRPFVDVEVDKWYTPYIKAAKDMGIVRGYADGFRPNDFMNRAAALTLLITSAGFDVSEAAADFTDVYKAAWYAPYVGYAQEHNVIRGYPDGSFGPSRTITRAEAAKIVSKLRELKAK